MIGTKALVAIVAALGLGATGVAVQTGVFSHDTAAKDAAKTLLPITKQLPWMKREKIMRKRCSMPASSISKPARSQIW